MKQTRVQQVTDKETQKALEQIIENAESVFQKGIGTLKGIKASLELEEDTSPKFFKARPVPYAIRPKVEAELDNLEKMEILTKVEWSEWATPIVPVIKKGKAGDRAMDQVLQGIPGTQCYLDDIIVTGKDDTDHLRNLQRVLMRLCVYGLRANKEKYHQPLVSIFNAQKGVSAMASARLQRWSLFLGAHQYDIEYKGTKLHGNADGLSCLPLKLTEESMAMDPADMFQTSIVSQFPVTNAAIQRETRNDPTLSKVYDITVHGWPTAGNSVYPAFAARREQLSVCQGTLMCGLRVVIPSKLRTPLHPWECPSTPWQRVHVDFAGPFMDSMFLIAVDAHSKWPEVVLMKTTTSEKTVSVLRSIFSRNGLPEQICTDNGRQFISDDFQKFMKLNGVKHITSAPYHPATNGLAERFVQTFKKAINAMDNDTISLQHKIDNFLFMYRNATHSTTGQTPAMMFLKRNLRSRLDLIKPDVRRDVENKQFVHMNDRQARNFQVGQAVLARDYRLEKWQPGTITTRTGPLMYTVKVGDNTWRRHADQLVNRQAKSSLLSVPDSSDDVPDLNGKVNDAVETAPLTSVTMNDSEPHIDNPDVTASVTPGPHRDSERRYPERCRKPPQRLDL
ncbi:hypothetical protein C0J45_22906 [Silurus meridionalis]|uniref:Integrase catalytic domain-containing protein n=1 Tax=Silurus meridionalis TaxID=175797 RepID=A0A8T0A6F1_SILME|nr:hypothetical protein HF521_015849 [Silurus meridionalis]KAI5087507.1 hypothetical protein C0J45_22906 [Silurus meridionalis]